MLTIDESLTTDDLVAGAERLFQLSGDKIMSIESTWDDRQGTPVFTVAGKYTTRGWTEWTQGFRFGSALLQFDACEDTAFLEIGRRGTLQQMVSHVSHIGVHDHGFNNVSTFGNLLRLIHERRVSDPQGLLAETCRLALKVSGAVQAARWTTVIDQLGFMHSFNGPHSLFVDTMRSLRSLALAHKLGHVLMGEQDRKISLLRRLLQHAEATARYIVYWGEGRDSYDIKGRTAHEALFNVNNGIFRCPSTQQGYSPFTTWTRGLAWAILGYAEQLEFLMTLPDSEFECLKSHCDGAKQPWLQRFEDAAVATADFYIAHAAASDGIPYWDTGAPGLAAFPDWGDNPADPYNVHEPVDSSAAAITAQGLLRLADYLDATGQKARSRHYHQAGLTIAATLLNEPYLCSDAGHQGLMRHSIYHRPHGWDYVPPESQIPYGESSMWGDYHARELGLMILRSARQMTPYDFFSHVG